MIYIFRSSIVGDIFCPTAMNSPYVVTNGVFYN